MAQVYTQSISKNEFSKYFQLGWSWCSGCDLWHLPDSEQDRHKRIFCRYCGSQTRRSIRRKINPQRRLFSYPYAVPKNKGTVYPGPASGVPAKLALENKPVQAYQHWVTTVKEKMALSDELRRKKEEKSRNNYNGNREGLPPILKLQPGQQEIIMLDRDETGKVMGKEFKRSYQGGPERTAIMFPVTVMSQGENYGKKFGFPLSESWALELCELAEEEDISTVKVKREGNGLDTKYKFRPGNTQK